MNHRAAQRRPDSPTFVACVPTIGEREGSRNGRFLSEILGVGDSQRRSHIQTGGAVWGVIWAVGLFGLAVWWGTAVFRRENA